MSLTFSIQKSWAKDKTTLVFAVTTSGQLRLSDGSEAPRPPKKLFLILQAGHRPKLQVVAEKPEPLTPDHPMAALLRKYAMPGQITGFSWDASGSIGAHMAAKRGDTLEQGSITLWAGGEWSGEFQWQGVSLCRIGSKGVFTKPKALEQPNSEIFYSPFIETPENQSFFRDLLLDAIQGEIGDKNSERSSTTDEHIDDRSTSPTESLSLPLAQRDLRDKLSRRLKTLRKARKKLDSHFPSHSAITLQEKIAATLQAHSHLVKPGADRLHMPPSELGSETPGLGPIFLDPEKSIGAQIDEAFIEVKRLRRAREKGEVQIAKAEAEMRICESDLTTIRTTLLSSEALKDLSLRHGFATDKVERVQISRPKEQEAKSFRKFDLGDGYVGLVGKNAAGNDELYRIAKGNDFFFHVIAPQGSHVIIPAKGRPPLAPEIRRKGAILAIHFSKAKQDLASEVYFTQRMHIAKKRGMAPGLVLIQRSETLHIRYDQAELETIVKNEILT